MDGTKPEARVAASPTALPGERAPLLSLRHVTKRFGRGVTALEGMNLSVNEGDFLSLLGPSGCGKSTALRIIAALSPPSLGRVEWSADPSGAERDRLGIVLQEPTLMPWATVADNVWLPLRLKGVSRRDADARISEALTLVGLAGREKAYPRELSGGMKMRVAIARAMVTRPRLILMDEPFAALDEITRFKLNNDLLAMKAAIGCTVIFVTHSIFESVFLSDRIVVMAARPGRVSSELAIAEPYPRSEDFRTSADYAAYCRATSEALHGAMGDEAPA